MYQILSKCTIYCQEIQKDVKQELNLEEQMKKMSLFVKENLWEATLAIVKLTKHCFNTCWLHFNLDLFTSIYNYVLFDQNVKKMQQTKKTWNGI